MLLNKQRLNCRKLLLSRINYHRRSEFTEKISHRQSQVESYEQLKELISVDTLKTMQLLGFNYKAAIGEPLTEICANAISKLGNKTTVSKRK